MAHSEELDYVTVAAKLVCGDPIKLYSNCYGRHDACRSPHPLARQTSLTITALVHQQSAFHCTSRYRYRFPFGFHLDFAPVDTSYSLNPQPTQNAMPVHDSSLPCLNVRSAFAIRRSMSINVVKSHQYSLLGK